MPSKDRIRFDNVGYFIECLFAEFRTDLGQASPLGVSKLNPALDLVA